MKVLTGGTAAESGSALALSMAWIGGVNVCLGAVTVSCKVESLQDRGAVISAQLPQLVLVLVSRLSRSLKDELSNMNDSRASLHSA